MRSGAKRPSLYVEYQIPSNTLIQNKGNGWAMIQGPNSVGGRNAARSRQPVPQMPPVRNIEVKRQK
jgi:hypothetical protein